MIAFRCQAQDICRICGGNESNVPLADCGLQTMEVSQLLTVNDIGDGFERKHGRLEEVSRPRDGRRLHLFDRHAMFRHALHVLFCIVQAVARRHHALLRQQ